MAKGKSKLGKYNKTHKHGKALGSGNKKARKSGGNTPTSLSVPFTPKQVRKEATSLTKQTYKPVKREIKREIKASDIQQKRINDYFPQYVDAVNKASGQSQAAYSRAASEIGASSKQATAYAEQLRQKLAGEEQANAAVRGAQYNAAAGSGLSADAQAARINAANVLTGVTQGQAANAKTYYADKAAIGRREQTEQLMREQARQRSLRQDKRDIVKEAGAFKTAKIGELTDRERDFVLGSKAAKLDKVNSRADRRLGRQAQRESERANRAGEALSAAQEARLAAQGGGGGGGKGGGSGGKGSKGSGYYTYKRAKAWAMSDDEAKNPTQAYRNLVNRGVPPKLAKKVIDDVMGGGKKPGGNASSGFEGIAGR